VEGVTAILRITAPYLRDDVFRNFTVAIPSVDNSYSDRQFPRISMGWYEEAKGSILIGSIAVGAFATGAAGSEALMKISGQDKVTSGTYTLNKDIQNTYILRSEYEKLSKERDILARSLNEMQNDLAQVNSRIAQVDLKRQTRVELEQLRVTVEGELKKKRTQLAAASQIMVVTDQDKSLRPAQNDYYTSIQQEIRSHEEQLRAIDKKLLEQF
jgi:hypothetical protein